MSDDEEKPFSIASFLATAVIVELVWLESERSRPALKAVISAMVWTRRAFEYQTEVSTPRPIRPHSTSRVSAVITPIEPRRSPSKARG